MPRIYSSLEEARSEIIRDLSRSPVRVSSRVQSVIKEEEVHEATGYSYLMHGAAFPRSPKVFARKAVGSIPYWSQWDGRDSGAPERWFLRELKERINPGENTVADSMHPELVKYQYDGESDYTYSERLPLGWVNRVARTLSINWDTRRVFIPIYHPEDFLIAHEEVRVPCTLGYGFRYRVDPEPHLEVDLIQRSVDFNKYWISDLGFAFYMGVAVATALQKQHGKILSHRNVVVYHYITSFHSFLQDEGEIY